MTSKLCCGHWVNSVSEGVGLGIDELGHTLSGVYCKDCADKLLKTKGVRMIREQYVYPPKWQNFTGDPGVGFVIDDELTELIKAIRNRCDVVLTLIEHYGTERLIPTVLEDLYTDAQTIVDDYCVKDA